MQALIEQEEILGALELGIMPPTGNIDKMLASLPADDARIARRKFRKLKRKLSKPARVDGKLGKWFVRQECIRRGRKILTKS